MKIQLKIQSKIRRNPCGILIPFKFLKTSHQLEVKKVFKYPIFYGIPWYLRNSVRYDVQMLHSGSSATGIGVAGILCPQWWSSVEQGQLKHFFTSKTLMRHRQNFFQLSIYNLCTSFGKQSANALAFCQNVIQKYANAHDRIYCKGKFANTSY